MTIRILEGHILDVLGREPAGSVHCAVTSPPYLWLRAYGTEPQVWPDGWVGELGQEETPERYVQHLVAVMEAVKRVLRDDGSLWVNLAGCYFNDPGGQNGGMGSSPKTGVTGSNLKQHEMYRTSSGFREREQGGPGRVSAKAMEANAQQGRQKRGRHPWLKALDWVDVPGLFAHAMQERGWTWRSDVTWVKPSALPESVSGTRWERCRVKTKAGAEKGGVRADRPQAPPTNQYGIWGEGKDNAEWADCPGCPRCAPTQGYVLRRGNGRPTKSSERVLVFAKKPGYYYDTEAVREPNTEGSIARFANDPHRTENKKYAGTAGISPAGMNATEWRGNGRNLRDVWTIGPSPIKDEHYAAYPPELPSRCIRAGTSERGCCPGCGAPWARVVETRIDPEKPARMRAERYGGSGGVTWTTDYYSGKSEADTGHNRASISELYAEALAKERATLGWRPTCRCPGAADLTPAPCRVLDPFAGSGTTLIAADRLGRDAVGVELKPQYVAMAQRRVVGDAPLLMWGAVTVEGDTTPSAPEAVPLLVEEPEDAVAGG